MAGLIISTQIMAGGQSQKVATSPVSAQSGVLNCSQVTLISDTNVFVRQGVNPTAVSDGTDQLLLANVMHRIIPIIPGQKLAFILATGTGNVYLTPEG